MEDLAVAEGRALRSSSRPWWLLPLGVFLLTRVVDAGLLLSLVHHQLPASQIADTGVVPTLRDPASYLNLIQNWDGQWFRLIAEHGYPTTLPRQDGAVLQNQWAFYPLFPFLVRALMTVTTLSYGVVAGLLNIVLSATGMCLVFRMISRRADTFAGVMTVLVLGTFPSAVVFQAAYSEALTFLLLVTSLYFLEQRAYGRVLVTGVLLSLTRPIVLPLALAVVIHGGVRRHARAEDPFPHREQMKVVGLAASLVASFALWPVIAWLSTGESRAFLSSMDAWKSSAQRTSGWESWLSQSFGGDWVALALVVVAVGAQLFFLFRPAARLWSPELRGWSLSYAAYLLVSTRPQSSFIRHLIMAIIPWWPFPEAGQRVVTRRQQVAIASLVAAGGFVAQYFWLRWFFVIGSDSVSFP
jgi:mannosyltransferase PIG-V